MTKVSFVTKAHNPDVLTCIANLSNDEVFTPPELANQILDSLENAWAMSNSGENLWTNKNLTFLDPCAKSGVFLREIVKRLSQGLSLEIPDLTERTNHILTKQVFGIGITELTSLLTRRTVYCSKTANGIHSVARTFSTAQGNIWYERVEHDWNSGRCIYCGANANEYARSDKMETHAYKFIHTSTPQNLSKELFGGSMHFDVVIGNPPYQLSVGNTTGNSSKARAIYHEFISQAIALNPRYIAMIIPSRWMTRSTEGIPETWIDEMIDDRRIRVLHDYLDSKLCFPGVDIMGGVCYFLWDRDSEGRCEYVLHNGTDADDIITHVDYLNAKGIGIVVRDVQALSIIEKIEKIEKDWLSNPSKNFSSMVSPKDYFTNKEYLTSSWDGFAPKKNAKHSIKYYVNKSIHQTPFGYVCIDDIPKNRDAAKLHKVYIPAARGGSSNGQADQVLGKPFVGEPNSVCSQTYLVIGYEQSQHKLTAEECENIVSYISTKFFRYLVSLKKRTQNGPRGVYQFVPIQDFSKSWTDKALYAKYKLDPQEIAFIEEKVKGMDLSDD
jgi:site-specific DNA-methyltransferase (adenine-specific)